MFTVPLPEKGLLFVSRFQDFYDFKKQLVLFLLNLQLMLQLPLSYFFIIFPLLSQEISILLIHFGHHVRYFSCCQQYGIILKALITPFLALLLVFSFSDDGGDDDDDEVGK